MTELVADFATRMAGGVALALLLLPWRAIPPAYFRTMLLVCTSVWVVAAFDLGFAHAGENRLVWAIAAAVAAYAGTVCWALGYARLGQMALLLVALSAVAIEWTWSSAPGVSMERAAVDLAARMVSSLVLGSSLAAMLLGHHYLTAPAMSIAPLKRAILLMGASLVARAVLAALPLVVPRWFPTPAGTSSQPLMLAMRWGLGLLAPLAGTSMAYATARIRSTQSATGILYATMTLVLLGEVAALVLARATSVPY